MIRKNQSKEKKKNNVNKMNLLMTMNFDVFFLCSGKTWKTPERDDAR